MKNIIIIGARGYKANYGGWETFVTNLIQNFNDSSVQFHVPELTLDKSQNKKVLKKDGVNCLQVYSPDVGFVTMFLYAIKALKYMKKYIKENQLQNVIIYVLGCRVGPFYRFLIANLKRMKIKIFLNPDGLEWKREKWCAIIKLCFRISEYCMVKHSDAIVSDSKAIKEYIDQKYKKFHKESYFIPYGAYLNQRENKPEKLFQTYQIKEEEYYLVVGRFVPENNYELIIREFMSSSTNKDLVIVSNVEENKFYKNLAEKTNFLQDKRVKFIGSIYEKDSLVYLRKHAYAYLHGHSAGGTNPSLLEALATTKINILFHAIYNVEVGEFACLYFSRQKGDLKKQIEKAEKFSKKQKDEYKKLAEERIKKEYTWDKVIESYKKVWKV